MICIKCLKPVDCLYSIYSNNHIQLTDCANCNNVADHYVEIDNVILFIDLLLLKPGAYRHLVYNSLEAKLSDYPRKESTQGSLIENLYISAYNIKSWLKKFDNMNRYWILLIAFEVYLTWSSEEQKFNIYRHKFNSSTIVPTTLITSKILASDPLYQYIYFATYCIVDISIFHYLTLYCIINVFNWGKGIKYPEQVISYTILLSYGAKIFPILMLIWPYDTVFSMSVIKWVANFYLIESLKIVTRLSYSSILLTFLFVSVVRLSAAKLILSIIISNSSEELLSILKSEYQLLIQKYIISKDFI